MAARSSALSLVLGSPAGTIPCVVAIASPPFVPVDSAFPLFFLEWLCCVPAFIRRLGRRTALALRATGDCGYDRADHATFALKLYTVLKHA